MKKMFALLFAFMLSLAILSVPSPASAAKSQCPWGYFCHWTGTNYSGTFSQEGPLFLSCDTFAQGGSRNSASSVYNNSPYLVYMYKNTGCTNGGWLVSNGQSYSSMPSGYDNNLESIRSQ